MGIPAGESFSPDCSLLTRAGRGAGGRSHAYRADRRQRARARRLFAEHLPRGIDVVGAADEEWRALMQLGRMNVQNSLVAIGGGAAGLLDDERERTGLVKQAQLASLVLAVRRIGKEAAAEEVAVEIGDEGPDVAGVHRLAISVLASVITHQRLDIRLPLRLVGVVHGQVSAEVGRPDV